MDQELDQLTATNWVVQECWRQITGPKPQTKAWLRRDDERPDTISWEAVLEAVDLLYLYQWIEYAGKGVSLTPELYTSVNAISFTDKAEEEIRRQLLSVPESEIVFTG